MTPKLSIIIPAYNSESCIEKCLLSVKSQTFKDFECIVIDDGSSDSTAKICQKFADSDCRFKILKNTLNRGVSFTRNLGLTLATGYLIGWVDSDDYIEPSHFEELCSPLLKDYSIDISICDVSIDKNGKNYGKFDVLNAIKKFDPKVKRSSKTSAHIGLLAICDDESCKSWLANKVFKKTLFKGIYFPNDINVLEDFSVMHKLFHYANTIYLTGRATYHNEQRTYSLSRGNTTNELWSWLFPAADRYFYVKPLSSRAASLSIKTFMRFYNEAIRSGLNKNLTVSIPPFVKPLLMTMLKDVLFSKEIGFKTKFKYTLLLFGPMENIYFFIKRK